MSKGDFRYLDTAAAPRGTRRITRTRKSTPLDFPSSTGRTSPTTAGIGGPVFSDWANHYDGFARSSTSAPAQGEKTPFTAVQPAAAVSRTDAFGHVVNLLGDTRDNLVNASSGYYLSMSLRNTARPRLGRQLAGDVGEMRVSRHVPAAAGTCSLLDVHVGSPSAGAVPQLPSNGWTPTGAEARGYLAGRVRGRPRAPGGRVSHAALAQRAWGAVCVRQPDLHSDRRRQIFGRRPGRRLGLRMSSTSVPTPT